MATLKIIQKSSLRAWLPFQDGVSPTMVSDRTGQISPGTMMGGATETQHVFGNGLSLPNSGCTSGSQSDYVDMGEVLQFEGPASLSLWVTFDPSKSDGFDAAFISKRNGPSDGTNYYFSVCVANFYQIQFYNGSGAYFSGYVMPQNKRTHLTFAGNGADSLKMYVNGIYNNDFGVTWGSGTPRLYLGGVIEYYGRYGMGGFIDDCRFYDSELSAKNASLQYFTKKQGISC